MKVNRYKVKVMTLTAMVAGAALLLPVQGNVQAQSNDYSSQYCLQNPHHCDLNYLQSTPANSVKQVIDRLANHKDIPGIIAAGMRNGERWAYAAGEASIYDTRQVKPDFHFRIGSVTKTFVATVIVQLAEEGKLHLDDSVEKWLPGVVQGNGYDGSKITIRQLLNHTSGIANYTSETFVTHEVVKNPYRGYTPEELVRIGLNESPLFSPGTNWSYSNTNYILAGLVIKQVTGETYGEQIKKRIIDPLQLGDTFIPGSSSYIPDQHARGYMKLAGKFIDMTELNPSWGGAAGDMISTAPDLNTFFSALLGGKLLKSEFLQQMLSGVDTPVGKYGLGIYETKLANGASVWGHSGGIHGFGTIAGGLVGGSHVLAISTNILDFDQDQEPANLYDIFEEEFRTVEPK
ncbi:serine hydrolase domain-containing protein [Paenibacillus arenosi]|uniref:Beta-lactamase family protein n=1 Tax=Paenibacillus arenosi TaxID=2774142 RepID=A0ABR9B1Z0_9BACL|nr:serine hydrolase domain-containing protein [Paenibacillus arenosi]MBD8499432.1 beta-lactamase family protein [Paenibacillus arenosi]